MSNTDNFDEPNDLDMSSDVGNEFEDFEDNKRASLNSSLKNSPIFKFGLIALAIVIVIGLVAIFGGKDVEAPASVVSKGAGNFKEAPGTKEVSPVMKEALEEKNQERVDEAQRDGLSAIPTPITPPKTLLDTPDEAEAEDPLLRWQKMQAERARVQREDQLIQGQDVQVDPQKEAKLNDLAAAMQQQIEKIMGDKKPKELQHMSVFDVSLLNGQAQQGSAAFNGAAYSPDADSAMQPKKPAVVIIPAGKIEYSQMILEANSDVPGPVVALIASGQFSGGKLLGKFTREEEYLVITFNTLVTKKGTSIPVNAYALDPATSLTGVATDVDNRYFKRIVLPAAAKFVEGLGDAYAETTSSSSQNSTTTTTTTTDLDTKQELGKAVSEAASAVGEILDEDGKNTEPLVIVAAGTPLGVLFMSSITDQDVLRARSGVTGGGTQNAGQPPYQGQNFQLPLQQQGFTGVDALTGIQTGLQNQQFFQQGNAPQGNVYPGGQPTNAQPIGLQQ